MGNLTLKLDPELQEQASRRAAKLRADAEGLKRTMEAMLMQAEAIEHSWQISQRAVPMPPQQGMPRELLERYELVEIHGETEDGEGVVRWGWNFWDNDSGELASVDIMRGTAREAWMAMKVWWSLDE